MIMKKHNLRLRTFLLMLLMFLTTACTTLSWNSPVVKRVQFDEPTPSGVAEVDSFTHDTFELYHSMTDMISDLDNFKGYLTGVANEPIPFLTETLTMDVQQSADLASLRYQKAIALEPDMLVQTIIDIQSLLSSRPTLKRGFQSSLRDLQTQLLSQRQMSFLRRVVTKALFLRRFSKAVKSTLSSPLLSLRERIHALYNLKKSVSVLGYVLITSKKLKSVRQALLKVPVNTLPQPGEDKRQGPVNFLSLQPGEENNGHDVPREASLPETEKRWQVQVACFRVSQYAERLRQRLESHHLGARISVTDNSQCPYRVVLVQLKFSRDEAQRQLQLLHNQLNIKGFRRKVD